MAPANSAPLEPLPGGHLSIEPLPVEGRPDGNQPAEAAGSEKHVKDHAPGPGPEDHASTEPVSRQELNAWRRGFTPQAEIWNGRLAMLGLSVGLSVLLLVRFASG